MTPAERNVIESYQQQAPIDITALATGLGLSVYESFDLPDGISGMISKDASGESRSGYSITVNAAEPYRRRRFTIAHECGHFLLHRDKIGDSLTDDAMYRSDKVTTREEFQANNMAADLLMPRNLMNVAVRSSFYGVHELAQRFDVSEPAMKVRLRYLYQMQDL